MARILDVGCGPYKFPGAIGVDMNPATQADVLAHLDRGALPFADNSFDQLRAVHLIEHVDDVIKTMEDFHRVVRPGGTIYIVTPHYTDFSSFCDPTHQLVVALGVTGTPSDADHAAHFEALLTAIYQDLGLTR